MTSDNDLIWRGDALAEIELYRGEWSCSRDAIAYMPAAPAHPVAVKVKPLVWEYHPSGTIAAPPTGQAYIIDTRTKGIAYFVKGVYPSPQFDTVDDAKAAAQADYEARILAALDVQPITVQDAARLLLGAMEMSKINPFDALTPDIEELAVKRAGNRGDVVAQLEIAEEFFRTALRTIAGETK